MVRPSGLQLLINCGMLGGIMCLYKHTTGVKLIFKTDFSALDKDLICKVAAHLT